MNHRIIPLLLLPLIFSSCAESVTHNSFMMDTVITYSITAKHADDLIDTCDSITSELENTLSAHIDKSEVNRFNIGEPVTLSKETQDITSIALDIYDTTCGAYDVTVAPLVKLWDIAHGDFEWKPPSNEEISALLPSVGSDKLSLSENTLKKTDERTTIDLGGIAKGYALGACAEYLTKNGATGIVSFGGSIAVVGNKPDGSPWNIGIKNPNSPEEICAVVTVDAGIISVSGGYERYREYDGVVYHHIIDPNTGYPSDSDLACAAVICPTADKSSGAISDALSTALFVMGKDASLSLYESGIYDFEAVLVLKDGSMAITDGLEGRFTKYEPET